MTNSIKKISILNYHEAYEAGEKNIGGKAFSIAKLFINNVKVPKGVVLPYQDWEYLKKNNDIDAIDNMLTQIVKKVECNRYVVRSSAIGEDSEKCSWAGCFESVLNIKKEELKEAIWKCGESLESKRAKAYKELHRDVTKIKYMGILIQEYIEAEWSGVCFSVNPVTKNLNEYVIEFQKGKSGSVVGGYGEPHTVIVNKDEYKNNIELPIPNNIYLMLIKNIKRIYKIWKKPVDIEWVVKKNNIYITQTRPITTIKINRGEKDGTKKSVIYPSNR